MLEKIKNEHIDDLFRAMMTLKNVDGFYKFFDDLCTVGEVEEMSKRFLAAKLLNASTVYSEVSEITGLSTATISRVNKCLKYGSDGYTTVLKRMKK